MSRGEAIDPDSTRRFSDRVTHYLKGRPSYPPELIEILESDGGFVPGQVIADLGAGTGLLSRLFLDAGYVVVGVEPNEPMRSGSTSVVGDSDRFRAVAGTAERSSLESSSVHHVVAGQAFHWFNPLQAGLECRRILRRGGSGALIWNVRRTGGTPFADGYEALLLRWGTDYVRVSSAHALEGPIDEFFGPSEYRRATLPNHQDLDLDSLVARMASSSYTPPPGDARHAPMLADLSELFESVSVAGTVRMDYDTEVFYGSLA